MRKWRKIPTNSEERFQLATDISEYVHKSPEYKALIDLGLTENPLKIYNDFYVLAISFISEIRTIYNSGGLKVNNVEHEYIEYSVFFNKINIDYDSVRQQQYGYKGRRKDKRIFYKIGNGIITGFKKLYIIYFKRIYESELGDEISFIHEIPEDQLALHIQRKWKSQYTKRIFLERLKTGNHILETEIVSSLNRK